MRYNILSTSYTRTSLIYIYLLSLDFKFVFVNTITFAVVQWRDDQITRIRRVKYNNIMDILILSLIDEL